MLCIESSQNWCLRPAPTWESDFEASDWLLSASLCHYSERCRWQLGSYTGSRVPFNLVSNEHLRHFTRANNSNALIFTHKPSFPPHFVHILPLCTDSILTARYLLLNCSSINLCWCDVHGLIRSFQWLFYANGSHLWRAWSVSLYIYEDVTLNQNMTRHKSFCLNVVQSYFT